MNQLQSVVSQLRRTLHPQFTQQAAQSLESIRQSAGFTTVLLLISDSPNVQIEVRISALVYLKNLVQQQCKNPKPAIIPFEDVNTLKQSILEMLVKTIKNNQNKLIPTLKYISYLFAKYYFKQNKWPGLIPEFLRNLETCSSYESIKGNLMLIKIIFQILGKSITEQIKLNNFSNKVILPLISVASRMFAELSLISCSLLQQILKIFTQAIEFHLPQIIQQNIHVFMVLVKNILDFKTDSIAQKQQNFESLTKITKLKKQTLIFLQKMYQRHSTSNLLQKKAFVTQFNKKYTKSYFQTIVGIIMGQNVYLNNFSPLMNVMMQNLNFDLITHSLGIFSFIAVNRQSQKYIKSDLEKYQLKILYLSMQIFLKCHSCKLQRKIEAIKSKQKQIFENYSDFVQTFREQRLSLRLFLSTIFTNKKASNRQKNIEQILQLLLNCIISGSLQQKQLALYLLSSLERDIEIISQQYAEDLNQKMVILLKQYVFPLLKTNSQASTAQEMFYVSLIKLRGFQMFARYEYLQIGHQHSEKLCQTIYQELLVQPSHQILLFVKVQAIQTFNSILATENTFIQKLSGNIPQILRIYTHLLSQQFQIMKFYEQILSLFSEYVSPIVYELLEMLVEMFFKLTQQKKTKFNHLSGEINYSAKFRQNQDDEWLVFNQDPDTDESSDDQTLYEDTQHKYENVGSHCLASIKKLIFKHPLSKESYVNSEKLQKGLLLLILQGLSSQDETFIKQSLSILNLLLYKGYICQNYHYLLPALLYPIYLSKDHLFSEVIIQSLNSSTTQVNHQTLQFERSYKNLLRHISQDPYSRVFPIFQEMGCLKNYIKILGKNLYTLKCPILNKKYVQMLVESVILVEQANGGQNFTQNQKMSILSIYETLIENRAFEIAYSQTQQTQMNFKQDPYFIECLRSSFKWNNLTHNLNVESFLVERFQEIQVRIIMLAIHVYPFQFFKFLETQIIQCSVEDHMASGYPFNKVFNEINLQIISKAFAYIKSDEQMKEPSTHLLNDSFIVLKGLVSLGQVLMAIFIVSDETNHFQRSLNALQSIKPLMYKIMGIVFKISIQVFSLIVKQNYSDKYQYFTKRIKGNIKFPILSPVSSEFPQKNINQDNNLGDQSEMLINMLKNLSVQQQGIPIAQQHLNSQRKQTEFTEFRIKHQNPPKMSSQLVQQGLVQKGLVQEGFFSSDSQDLSDSSSLDQNPFQSSDEQYLYAYDSPILGGSFTDNKKNQAKKIIFDLMEICMSQKMHYLRQFATGQI